MDDVAIRLENVSKYYRLYGSKKQRLKEALHPLNKKYHEKFYALNNINLEIKKGEVIGIVGRNGSGKSTLLKIISSVLIPSSGSVFVDGKISALLELGSGFNPEFTGIDNIYFYGAILGLNKEQINEKLEEIISFSDIGKFMYQPLKCYSNGMKARLGFSVAVNVDPDILILDEVLAVGDDFFKRKCYAKMKDMFDSGKTILFVSHSRQNIVSLCSRAILIHDNRVFLSGDPKTVTEEYQNQIIDASSGTLQHHDNYEKSPDDIQSSSIKINKFVILDNENNEVSNLVFGSIYNLLIDVTFNNEYENVSINLQVRTIEGICISALNLTRTDNILEKVSKMDSYQFSYKFNCILKEGAYFFDIAINSNFKLVERYQDIKKIDVINNDTRFGGVVKLFEDVTVQRK